MWSPVTTSAGIREKTTGTIAAQIPDTVREAMMPGHIDHAVAEYDDTEWYVERLDILPVTAGLALIEQAARAGFNKV